MFGSLSAVLISGAYFYRDFSLHRQNCINKQEVRYSLFLADFARSMMIMPMIMVIVIRVIRVDLFGLCLSGIPFTPSPSPASSGWSP